MSTLSSWSAIAYVNIFGCDVPKSMYTMYTGGTAKNPYRVVDTGYGTFPLYDCYSPQSQPVVSVIFFFIFTVVTSMVIMSLFIGAITMAMFGAFEDLKMRKLVQEYEGNMNQVRDNMFEEDSELVTKVGVSVYLSSMTYPCYGFNW